MKKKLTSIFLVAAILSTMLATTVFGGTTPLSADDIKTQMDKTATFVANNTNESAGTDTTKLLNATRTIFYVAASGCESDAVKTLTSNYTNAIKDKMNTDGKITISNKESIENYANVIATLLLMDKDPENLDGINLVSTFNSFLNGLYDAGTAETDFSKINPYNIGNVLAVFNYYQDKFDKSADSYQFMEALLSKYFKEGETSGMDYWGFSADNDAVITEGFNVFPKSVANNIDFGKINSVTLANLAAYTDEETGLLVYDKSTNSPNADSTGVALSYFSTTNNLDKATNCYNALLKLSLENGAFCLNLNNSNANAMASADALHGIESFYRAFVGAENIYSLKPLQKAMPTNELPDLPTNDPNNNPDLGGSSNINTGINDTPKTGDSSSIVLLTSLAGAALAVVVITCYTRKLNKINPFKS